MTNLVTLKLELCREKLRVDVVHPRRELRDEDLGNVEPWNEVGLPT